MVATFCFAGFNLHQFMASYDYVSDRLVEFRDVVKGEGGGVGLSFLSVLFYGILPAAYLFLLFRAGMFLPGVTVLAFKLGISAVLGLWMQRHILREMRYPRKLHLIGKVDSLINVAGAAAVGYFLVYPR